MLECAPSLTLRVGYERQRLALQSQPSAYERKAPFWLNYTIQVPRIQTLIETRFYCTFSESVAGERKLAQGSFYPFEIHFKRQDLFEQDTGEEKEAEARFKYALTMGSGNAGSYDWKAMGKISGIISLLVSDK